MLSVLKEGGRYERNIGGILLKIDVHKVNSNAKLIQPYIPTLFQKAIMTSDRHAALKI